MITAAQEKRAPSPGRRMMLGWVVCSSVLASFSSILYPIFKFVLPPRTGELDADTVAARADELKPNSAKIFRFGAQPAILVRMADGQYRAFSAVCTHLNCTIQFRDREHDLWCACHNGVYDQQGQVVSGPPPRPLPQYAVHIRGQEIVVSRERPA
jgi:Rieske Fe-S protein